MPKDSVEPINIGCELLVSKGNKILLGLRGRKIFGAGTWALPGGHLEFNERLIDAACREAKEELGATVTPKELKLVSVFDSLPEEGALHYIHITFEIKNPQWQPRVMEPEECDEWRYFELDDLPDNFLVPHKGILDNYRNKRLYSV
jgi:8-oxo-dGTP diphosphatase